MCDVGREGEDAVESYSTLFLEKEGGSIKDGV